MVLEQKSSQGQDEPAHESGFQDSSEEGRGTSNRHRRVLTGSQVLVVRSNLDNDAENMITLSLVGHSRIVEQRGSTRAKDVDWSGLGRELLRGLCFMRIDTLESLAFKYFRRNIADCDRFIMC